MALRTPIYDLTAHTYGEVYSASADRRRMAIIDHQLAFLADLFGDGIIDGWDVTVSNESTLEIEVSPGVGIIDRFAIYTFGSMRKNLVDNTVAYLYMRKKKDIIGGFSGFSDIANIELETSDFSAPSTPSNLSVESISFDKIDLSWDENTSDVDFDHYVLYRSTNNIDFSGIADDLTDDSYNDTDVEQDTNYYYKVSAVNRSGQESSLSSALHVKTEKDLRQPLPPRNLQSVSRDEAIQVFWSASPSGNVKEYHLEIVRLDDEYQPVGDTTVITVDESQTNEFIQDLTNDVAYRITIKAISINDVTSSKLSVQDIPTYSQGPFEVSDVTVTHSEGDNVDSNVVTTVSFVPTMGPYIVPADRYYLEISENAGNFSQAIVIPDGDTEIDVATIPFEDEDGNIVNEPVKADTRYIYRLVAVDEAGDESNGYIVQSRTPVFTDPPPPSNVEIEQKEDGRLFVSWRNSASAYFSHNLFTFTIENIVTNSVDTIVDKMNIGKQNHYIVSSNLIENDRKYTFSIQSVDSYGNLSEVVTTEFTIGTPGEDDRPSTPERQTATPGNSQVKVQWAPAIEPDVTEYKIYRAETTFFPLPSSFSLIDTVPVSVTEYIDYSAKNDVRYVYLVTAVNRLGQESLNPNDDNTISGAFSNAIPRSKAGFEQPDNLSITQSGHDAQISWDPPAGDFDGVEIWRSIDNLYEFEKITELPPGKTSYTDENVLLEAEVTYNYIIRTFRNEASLFLTESASTPRQSIIIAKLTTSDGNITINQQPAVHLLNLEDPIREKTKKRIKSHTHEIDSRGNDKRIDLNSNIVVDDWETFDYRQYRTDVDIQGAASYIVNVEGNPNQSYFTEDGEVNDAVIEQMREGIPPFIFEVDGDEGTLTFETKLYDPTSSEDFPYSSEPQITVKLVGVEEVKNTLPRNKVGEVDATSITSGSFSQNAVPTIHHEGRIKEKLLPKRFSTETEDQIVYEIADDEISFNSTRTFYYVLQVEDDKLFAAASDGLLVSEDFGSSWSLLQKFDTPPHKILYAEVFDKYFVLTNNAVYTSQGSLISWSRVSGISNVGIIRDIIEDTNGNLFLSTDLGTYILEFDQTDQLALWEQTSLFGPRSTEAYALLNDVNEDRIIVSNELGILESTDSGASWSFTNEFDKFEKIFDFIQTGNFIFALTNNAIYRKKTDENFVEIAKLDVKLARKIVIYHDMIFATTDQGILSTDSNDDIYNDTGIELQSSFPQVNQNGFTVPITSLNIVEDFMFVGTDQRLFMRQNDETWIQYDQLQGQVPSIYVDGQLQSIGFTYDSANGRAVIFDEKQNVDSDVKVAVKYDNFSAVNGGWAIQNYKARVDIFVNDDLYATTEELDEINLNVEEFDDFEFPDATRTNSYLPAAIQSRAEAESKIERLEGIVEESEDFSLGEDETMIGFVADVYRSIEEYLSHLYPESRVDSEGNPIELPGVDVNLDGVTIDLVNGDFVFDSTFDKYDKINVSIYGSTVDNIGRFTHSELEDHFEYVNSGLPSSLSQAKQTNVAKLGVFNERIWPGEQSDYTTPYQADYFVPEGNGWYDVLNSTVDYEIQNNKDGMSKSLLFPTTVLHVDDIDSVFVGGPTGGFSIGTSHLDIEPLSITDKDHSIKKFYQQNDTIYALTNDNLFISEDFGLTWEAVNRTGLPQNLFSLAIVNSNILIGSEDGIYYKAREQSGWIRSLESDNPVEIMIDPDVVFALVDNTIYFTTDGIRWTQSGNRQPVQINSLAKFKNVIFAGTNRGLYRDDGTFYSGRAILSLVNTRSSSILSRDMVVNDMTNYENYFVAGLAEGATLLLSQNNWSYLDDYVVDAIHKTLFVGSDLWIFSYDQLNIIPLNALTDDNVDLNSAGTIERPIKISTGAPL